MPANPAIHPSADVLQSLNLGKLDNETAQKVVRHLDDCPACRQAIAGLSGDSFLDRLRDARDRSGTNIPAKALPKSAKGSPAGRPADSLPPAVADLPPELADNTQYHVLRELGRGGMGVVYLAKNVLMDRPEVLKVLNKALLDTPAAAERFLREIRSAAKLSHDNVVKAHSALALGELLVFAMEYVEGEDLAQVVKRQGPLPVPWACFYTHQVALGLQHAHEHGLVHRDIKPQNLILSRQEKKHLVKVLDFGLAKATREGKADTGLTGAGMVLGTPDYIAPEQAMDAANADIRADVYSLGCTLYFLLTGTPPFQGKSLMEVLQAHLLQEARPLNQVRDEVPAELAAVVAKMMAKEPAQRYQKPIEAAQALASFVKAGAKPVPAGAVAAAAVGAAKGARPGQPRPGETASVWAGMVTEGGLPVAKARQRPAGQPAGKRWRVIGAGIAACVLLLGLVGLWAGGIFKVKTKDGTIVVENLPTGAEVFVDGEQVALKLPGDGQRIEIQVAPGKRKLEIKTAGFKMETREVTLASGERKPIDIRLEPQPPVAKPKIPEVALPKTFKNSLGMKLVLIPAGKFTMGSPAKECERCQKLLNKDPWVWSEAPEHEVEITQPFYMGATKVTVGQFRQFVNENKYQVGDDRWLKPGFAQTDDHPVVMISWKNAGDFCTWLSQKEGKEYRLPTEAEWEYSCRSGKAGARYCYGNEDADLGLYAWYNTNSGGRTHPVGQLKENAWGLFDMHGNAWEMCQDYLDWYYYKSSPKQNPPGGASGQRVRRGGSWMDSPPLCRSAFRLYFGEAAREWGVGFRVVLRVPSPDGVRP